MKIFDVVEGKLPNKHVIFDVLSEIKNEPMEIRQTYNKCYKNKIKSPNKKRATVLWAEFMLATPRNKELKDMLDFIIDYCKNK